MPNIWDSIVKTLVYADIFDYPLNLDELNRWLIYSDGKKQKYGSQIKITHSQLKSNKNIDFLDGYYFLKGRSEIVGLRKKRIGYSLHKMPIAKKGTRILSFIPFIKMIALSGNLALENADKNDDIDFFIITSRKRLWITRFFSSLILYIAGMKRKPKQKNVKNKICLNMFLDEDNLEIPHEMRNIFSAHESCQIIPLLNRDETFEKFMNKNYWVKDYLPNTIISYNIEQITDKRKQTVIIRNILDILEKILRNLQVWYMRKKITREIIQNGRAFFHPTDVAGKIIMQYERKIKTYTS